MNRQTQEIETTRQIADEALEQANQAQATANLALAKAILALTPNFTSEETSSVVAPAGTPTVVSGPITITALKSGDFLVGSMVFGIGGPAITGCAFKLQQSVDGGVTWTDLETILGVIGASQDTYGGHTFIAGTTLGSTIMFREEVLAVGDSLTTTFGSSGQINAVEL